MVILKFFWCKYKAKSDLRGDPPFDIHMPYKLDKSCSVKSSRATKNFHSGRVSNIKRLVAQRGCCQYSYGLVLFLGIRTKYSRPLVITYLLPYCAHTALSALI